MGGPKLHIVFVINSLVGGGAERALINIIAGLEPFVRDHRVSLILLDDLPSIYQVPSFVEKHVLNSRERFGPSMVNLTKLMRSIKPDVAVSFLSRANCANVFASKIAGYPAIISERVHTSNHFGYGVKASLQKIVIGLFYRRAKQIIAVSSGVARDLAANFKVAPERLTVIHNPIDMSKLTRMSQDKAGVPAWPRPYIAAVGRLVPNKNFAMMLCAFAQSGDPGNLVILGDGPERATLEALSVKLGIQDRVFMPGFVSNPFPAIAGAKYLVSSSNAEGFPNAIVEAMALGCAVIATDCEAGPADILSPDAVPARDQVTRGAYGFLVPVQKPSLLAEAMKLFQDDTVLANYRSRTKPRVLSYAPDRICMQYWQTIVSHLPLDAARASGSVDVSRPNRTGIA